MANNVPITAGSGTTVGTDDCGGVHISLVKLVDSTEDSTTRTGIAASPLQVSLANTATNATAVKVDGSAVTQPVSLASVPSHAVTNAGTFAVQVSSALPAGTNNIGDVDVLSCALPTGAATAAKQPALGTAGSPSSDVITVQGVTSMTALKVDGSAVTQPVSGTVSVTGVSTAANQTTIIGHVDGIEGLLTTIDADTGSIATSASSIDGKITACNTGAVVLAANSGVDIGDVDVTSLPALAAGTNLIGQVSSSNETSTVYNGTTALTPKFAAIDAATSGDNTLVAAVSSKKIRVLSLFLVAAGTVNVRFESGAGGTALSGQMNLIANTGFVLPYNPVGWLETASNTLLNMELSAAISCDGSLTYVEV